MEDERLYIASSVKCHPSLIFMEAEIIDNSSWERKTLRMIRRIQADGDIILAVVLEIDHPYSQIHSKSLLDSLERLPRTLTYLSWLTIDGERESIVVHSHLTPNDEKELIRRYSENRELDTVKGIKLDETTDTQMVRQILKQGVTRKQKRE